MCVEQDVTLRRPSSVVVSTAIVLCKPHREAMYASAATVRDCPRYELLRAKEDRTRKMKGRGLGGCRACFDLEASAGGNGEARSLELLRPLIR
ncbi:unnamed protein product [Diplocarpon coronariae]